MDARTTVADVFVKICGITRPGDALAAADAGADAVGLNFVPTSRRRIDVATARSIMAVVPAEVMAVGVFRDQPVDEVLEIVEAVGLTAVQLHGDETPEDAAAVVALGTPREYRCLTPHRRDAIDRRDTAVSDTDCSRWESSPWDTLGDLASHHRLLLAGGLDPENVGEAVRRVRPWGVDVATGVESSPGHKDADMIRRFVRAAHATSQAPPPAEPGTGVSGS